MRTLRYLLIVLVALLPLPGCEYLLSCGCEYEMKKIGRKYGKPDRKSTIKSSAGYRAENWGYNTRWGTSRKYTFEWDRYDPCYCEVIETTYYARKLAVEVQERRWSSAAGEGEGDCVLCPSR